MKYEDYKKAADEIAGHKINSFWLQNYGESTLHPDLIRMIEYADQKGIEPLILSTNCTTLNDNMADDLLRSGLDYLVLSLDGATKETFERLRAGADYEQVVKNIQHIFQKKNELKIKAPILILQIVYSNETKDEINAYIKQWEGFLNKDDQISLKAYNDFAGQVEVKYPTEKEFARMPCQVFFGNLVILWNGDATPCCMDIEGTLKVGNVFSSSIGQVWNGEAYNKLRKAVNDRNYQGLDICRKCTQGVGRSLGVFTSK